MRHIITITLITPMLMMAVACGNSNKDDKALLNEKKTQLTKLRSDQQKLNDEIKKLEQDIAKLDTASSNAQKAKLVAVDTLKPLAFEHFIELQGRIDAENISYIMPRGQGGLVKQVLVKQGEFVKKGQLLLKLDDAIVRQNLVAARQNLETIKTQLSFAKNIYQRQKNLWEQNIGTEVQLITAKNNVESLENQLKATEENVKVVAEQLSTSNVYSDVSGIADVVTIRVGEVFTGNPAMGIKIVNTSSLKAIGNIPENYLGSVTKGTGVIVNVPDAGKSYNTAVSFIGASIDPASRGFSIEARLPADAVLKPNQIALLKIRDYSNPAAMSIPVNTLQNDEKGKFVMVASRENGKLIARKRPVMIGMLNGDRLEVKSGLQAGDVLVTEGFQSLYDGLQITTDVK